MFERVALPVANCGTTRYLAPAPVTHEQRVSSDPRNVLASNVASGTTVPTSAEVHPGTTEGSGPDESEHAAANTVAAGMIQRVGQERIQTSIR